MPQVPAAPKPPTSSPVASPRSGPSSIRPAPTSVPPGPGSVRPVSPSVRPPPADLEGAIAELDHTKRVLASKLIELRKFQTEREALLVRLAEKDARIRELEGATSNSGREKALADRVAVLEVDLSVAKEQAARAPRLDAEVAALRATQRRLELTITERDRRIGELEQEIQESLAWTPPPADDLKKIRGIGPKFEQTLHGLGVRSFVQIAGWSPNDVAEVAAKLKVHASRIEREGWIAAAKALAGMP